MKKIIALALVAVMVLSFTACGKKKEEDKSSSSDLSSSSKDIDKALNTKNLFENKDGVWEALVAGDNIETYKFAEEKEINAIRFEEIGKKVDNIKVEAMINGSFMQVYEQDEMATRTGLLKDTIKTNEVRVTITSNKTDAKVKNISFEKIEPIKTEKPFRVASYIVGPFDEAKVKGFDGRLSTTTEIILIGYYNFDDKGNLVGRKGFESLEKDLADLRAAMTRLKIKPNILLCLGTFEGDKANKDLVFSTPEIRTNFIKQGMEMVKKYKLDGIDIDYEYPDNATQWAGYSSVVVELKAELAKQNKQISVALPPWGVDFSKEAIAALDQVQLMNYDLFDDKRRHAPYEVFSKSIDYCVGRGFKKEQLNPGLALYGREINKTAEERWPSYAGMVEKHPEITRDTNSLDNSYFTGVTMNNDKIFKAIESGCGGVMSFRYACDLPFDNELSIYRGLSDTMNKFIAK